MRKPSARGSRCTEFIKVDLNKKIVYLIGMMGSGKSSVGKRAARLCGYDFCDLDSLIEKRAGRKITEIFAEDGEAAFRSAEKGALADVSETNKPTIVSCGGGIILDPENTERMRESGIVILIEREIEKIKSTANVNTRPLLKNSAENIKKIYDQRKPLYQNACHYIVKNNDSVAEAAQSVADLLKTL